MRGSGNDPAPVFCGVVPPYRDKTEMMKKIPLLLVSCLSGLTALQAQNDYTAAYVDLGRQSGVLYQPVRETPKAGIGIIVMHSHQDYLNFIANAELAKRGYTVLATLPDQTELLENKLLNIKNAVDYLRSREDINRVLLLGHSGGATVMTAYEYLAENGRKGLEGKLFRDYSSRIDNLPEADGILLFDANPGLSTVMLNSLDPNVTDESTGFQAEGPYSYDNEREYMRGQQARYNRLVKSALERLQLIQAGKGRFADDEPLVIPGSNSIRFYNKLYSSNTSLLHHTKGVWPLIHADGSVTTDTVYSVRAPFRPSDRTELLSAAQSMTVRGFLSSFAMTVDDDYEVLPDGFRGIRFDSNLTSPIGNIEGIRIPSLFMGMTGSYEYLTSEAIYNHSPAKDKTLVFVEGAGHMFVADKQAEACNQADYGDTVKNMFDYADHWLEERFCPGGTPPCKETPIVSITKP